jgi:hypothetical protein
MIDFAADFPGLSFASPPTLISIEEIQALWAGFGHMYRVHLAAEGAPFAVMVKTIDLQPGIDINTLSVGDRRRYDSYTCEASLYSSEFASLLLAASCSIPRKLLPGHPSLRVAGCRAKEGQLDRALEKGSPCN